MTLMLTATGRSVDLARFSPEDVELEHVAHCLARINRFGGVTMYSVAAHSLHVAQILDESGFSPLVQLCGLLHDAHEAYMGDITQPVKQLLSPQGNDCHTHLQVVEHNLQKQVLRHFKCYIAFVGNSNVIHHADMVALATEKRDLMPASDIQWSCLQGITPHPANLDDGRTEWHPSTWADIFRARVDALQGRVTEAELQKHGAAHWAAQ